METVSGKRMARSIDLLTLQRVCIFSRARSIAVSHFGLSANIVKQVIVSVSDVFASRLAV